MDDLWLDSVLAVPTVGVHLKTPASVFMRLTELVGASVDQLANFSDLAISEPRGPAGMELKIEGTDGYTHRFAQKDGGCHAIVSFAFAPKESKNVGELPTMAYQVRFYKDLVKECVRRVDILTSTLLKQPGVYTLRLGLAAQAELADNQLPPGLQQYRHWHERPWKTRNATVQKVNSVTLARFEESETHTDQCHHGLAYDSTEPETEFRVTLDYQRVFKKAPTKQAADMMAFSEIANIYFQDFAFPEASAWQ